MREKRESLLLKKKEKKRKRVDISFVFGGDDIPKNKTFKDCYLIFPR